MASCIPTLGPLYEMARGKRSWSSHQRYYKSSGNNAHSSSHDRHIPARKHTFSGQRDRDLITTNISTTKNGSQESILRVDEQGKGPGIRPGIGVGRLPKGSIQRTDQVVVEYEMRPMDREGQPSW
jgi:hypothetical protein